MNDSKIAMDLVLKWKVFCNMIQSWHRLGHPEVSLCWLDQQHRVKIDLKGHYWVAQMDEHMIALYVNAQTGRTEA